ncbi:MAG: alpha-2-macroglobulin family protein [Bacillota bacterium]|nr:alpha-2-macroglobulin family protein [Bacillota bacterium]
MAGFFEFKNRLSGKMLTIFLSVSMILSVFPLGSTAADSIDGQSVTVTAQKETKKGIAVDSGFIVKGDGITEDFIQKRIVITPKRTFKTEAQPDGTYIITPDKPFESNVLVTVSLTDENGDTVNKWAFQTEQKFKILGTRPDDEDSSVHLNAGIELEFSESDVDLDSLKSAFSITPNVTGQFKMFADTAAFIPDAELSYGTVYKVTVSTNVKNNEGEKVESGIEFRFKTIEEPEDTIFYSNKYSFGTFIPSDPIALGLSVADDYKNEKFKVSVYRFSPDDYLAELSAYCDSHGFDFKPDLYKSSEFMTFTSELTKGQSWDRYIVMPQNFNLGFYCAVISATDNKGKQQSVYKYFQVSNLSVYGSFNDNDGLVWVNRSSGAVSGATVKFKNEKGTDSGVTGKNGSTIIKWDKIRGDNYYYQDDCVLKIQNGGDIFIDIADLSSYYCCDYYGGYYGSSSEDYYSYLYTDREMYLPTDKVQMWGLIRPRKDGVKKPENLKAVISDGDDDLYETPVTLSDSGTFSCELSFSDLKSDYYSIRVVDGDDAIFGTYVEISDYVKPVYVFSAKPEQEVYVEPSENPVVVDVNCQFFEGSPTSNLPVSVDASGDGNLKYTKKFNLGRDGSGKVWIKQSVEKAEWWEPDSLDYRIYTDSAENKEQVASGSVMTFNRDTMLYATVNQDRTIDVETNKMNLSGIHTEADYHSDNFPENIKGEPVDIDVTLTKTHYYYVSTGTYSDYDFINKKTISFQTYEVRTDVTTRTFKTVNGKFKVTDLPYISDNAWDEYEFSYKDGRGRDTISGLSAYEPYYCGRPEPSQYKNYSFEAVGNPNRLTINEKNPLTFFINENNSKLKLGNNGRYLTAKVQSDTFDVTLSTKDEFTVNFDKKLIPNFELIGAYFDGKHIFPIEGSGISYDPSEKELTVNVKTDKEVYRPSDKVNAEVTVLDKSGKPVPNADICMSVVDEAQFAIAPQGVNMLATLYGRIYYPSLCSYVSYTQYYGSASGGGGASDSASDVSPTAPASPKPRSKFVDNTAFLTLKTDKDGKAKTEFTLADNLTSWRITTLAVSPDLGAGSSKIDITSKLAMFVSPVVPDTFITGDTVNFSSRAYGTEVEGTQDISYTATVEGNGVSKSVDVSAKAMDDAIFKFGTLSAGNYTLTITGSNGNLSDSILKPFSVIDCGLQAQYSDIINFDDIKNIKPVRYPVYLEFFSNDYLVYNRVLSNLAHNGSWRSDAEIASSFAWNRIYSDIYGKSPENDVPYEIKNADGLIPLLSEDKKGDPVLTGRIASAAPDYINKSSVNSALYGVISGEDSTPEQVAAAYMGLASLGSPVLIDIKSLLKNGGGFSELDKLRLTAGLALAGDFEGAKDYYNKLIAPKLTDTYDKWGDPALYYKAGDDNDMNIEMTAAASITASILRLPSADLLVRYLCSAESQTDLTVLEQMVYVTHFKPKSSASASFSYTQGGKTETAELDKRGFECLSFTKEQFADTSFSKISGDVGVMAFYTGYASENKSTGRKDLRITKKVTPESNVGDEEKVTVTVENAPKGYISIQDYVPTGARYSGKDSWKVYLNSSEKQNLRFKTYNDSPGMVTFSYYVRNVTPGVYICEAPIVKAEQTNEWGQGERQSVIIN